MKILECLKEIFKIAQDQSLESIILENFSEWDSFNIMQMLECFESDYSLILSLDDLRGFETMQDIYIWVVDKIGREEHISE